ncbi:MAG: hypothetical protein ACYDA9_05630 [Terriglobia bacterium]
MKREAVISIIETKYRRYVGEIIKQIKALGPEYRHSGDDSGLADVWEEWKSQIQGEESLVFDAYENTFIDMCGRLVTIMPEDERALLWLTSEACFNGDRDLPPDGDELINAIVEELYRRLCTAAANEEMSSGANET